MDRDDLISALGGERIVDIHELGRRRLRGFRQRIRSDHLVIELLRRDLDLIFEVLAANFNTQRHRSDTEARALFLIQVCY